VLLEEGSALLAPMPRITAEPAIAAPVSTIASFLIA
jgi:hypothetical protein